MQYDDLIKFLMRDYPDKTAQIIETSGKMVADLENLLNEVNNKIIVAAMAKDFDSISKYNQYCKELECLCDQYRLFIDNQQNIIKISKLDTVSNPDAICKSDSISKPDAITKLDTESKPDTISNKIQQRNKLDVITRSDNMPNPDSFVRTDFIKIKSFEHETTSANHSAIEKKINTITVDNIEVISSYGVLFYLDRSGIKAAGYPQNRGFVVVKGSQMRSFEADSLDNCRKEIRNKLKNRGIVVDGCFVEDYVFRSSSEAASCLLGAQTSGNQVWHDEDGKMLKLYVDGKPYNF